MRILLRAGTTAASALAIKSLAYLDAMNAPKERCSTSESLAHTEVWFDVVRGRREKPSSRWFCQTRANSSALRFQKIRPPANHGSSGFQVYFPDHPMPTFYDRFVACAARRPNNPALELQGHDHLEGYTYAEVRQMAESVGRWVTDNGFACGARLAIFCGHVATKLLFLRRNHAFRFTSGATWP